MPFYRSCAFVILSLHQILAQDINEKVTELRSKNAVQEILNKINEFSVHSFSNAPYSAKLEMLRNIEEKLKKAGKALGTKGERYIKLIMKGIKAKTFAKMSDSDLSKTQVEIPVNNSNYEKPSNVWSNKPITNVSIKSHDGTNVYYKLSNTKENLTLDVVINKGNNSEEIDESVKSELKEHLRRMNIISNKSDEKYSHGDGILKTNTKSVIQSFTSRYECEGSLDRICLNIKQMRLLKCQFSDSIIPIKKLCDSFSDCPYKTDEKYCTSQVTERIHNANQVIHETDQSFRLGCFPNKTEKSIISSQIIVLRSVLHAQHEFVQKYKYFNFSMIPHSEYLKGEGKVKHAVNEITLIISTLSLALEAEVCSQLYNSGNELSARKFNDLLAEDFDKVLDEVRWPPKSCTCKGGRCENTTMCSKPCMRVCWQKHSLTRWSCPSINETENVPMSLLCDGKFDCLDESDENDCVTGLTFAKFEAHKIFKDISDYLSSKVATREYTFLRNMFLSLHSTIEELQKFSMASEPDLKIIRSLRNRCFNAISSIYWETIRKSSFHYQASEIYLFLLSLGEKIVNALKHSHTGNKRIISNDGCHCRDGRCNMPICSINCRRSCVAEPWLTRYFCKNSYNKSIPLEYICNGKTNCPHEDDESNCQKEICRRHHLTILQRNIQKIGKEQEGTSMGELLAAWKTKVSSTLLIAANNARPSPSVIRDIIRDILNDLVQTYGAVKDYRRDNEYALEEFTYIARFVMKFLRSCSY